MLLSFTRKPLLTPTIWGAKKIRVKQRKSEKWQRYGGIDKWTEKEYNRYEVVFAEWGWREIRRLWMSDGSMEKKGRGR
jgi:hypothetical protein